MSDLPRSEYPRPQFVRGNWMNLNGEWDFSFDQDSFDQKIIVPYAYQTKLSGIHVQEIHDIVWYRRYFDLPVEMESKNILLHFGAVDYECEVYVNGALVTKHTGGHINFSVDITKHCETRDNELTVKVLDETADMEMPRGKQFWEEKSRSIFYTRTTGIWQTVWIEAVDTVYLERVWLTPDIDNYFIEIEYEIFGAADAMDIEISYQGSNIANISVRKPRSKDSIQINVDQNCRGEECFWSPEHPNLFDVRFVVMKNNAVTDEVQSYFGMRKVSIENGKFMLNNRPYYQKLLLDQGYWEESTLTAPTDGDYILDIQLAKDMGFNGVRKHQKIEDPRFLYHADKMGFLVWGEIAAAYKYSRKYVKRIMNEFMDEIFRDYSHPCIVAWTPINESWGVQECLTNEAQRNHISAMVHTIKSLDSTRPVVSNDGWEHTSATDLLTIHDYSSSKEALKERYKTVESSIQAMPADRKMLVEGKYENQPVLITEFGGISYQKDKQKGWGYSNATDDEDFIRRYNDVVSALLESSVVQGFCYTQLTDVEQEINGLLTFSRKPKVDTNIIKAINEGRYNK